jgi:hypothetical protein
MGSCGCGDYAGEFKLPGPDGSVYVIQRYAGCNYCMSPAGVIVYKMLLLDGDPWETSKLPDLPFGHDAGGEPGDEEILIPIAHAPEFVKGLKPWFEGRWEEYFEPDDDSGDQLADLMEDGLDEKWTEIIHASMKWENLLEVKKG